MTPKEKAREIILITFYFSQYIVYSMFGNSEKKYKKFKEQFYSIYEKK